MHTKSSILRSTQPVLLASLLFALLGGAASNARADNGKHLSEPAAHVASEEASAPETMGVVNVNTASVEELCRLPGIGETRAQAFIDMRTRQKGFTKLEDLMRIKGIGRKTFRKLRPMLTLQGTTTLLTKAHLPRNASE